jgi:hypothetical protein
MGRWGSTEPDEDNYEPPVRRHRRWRIRIKTDDVPEIPQREQRRSRTSYEYHGDLRDHIKQLVLKDELMPVRELTALVALTGEHVSIVTLSHIRREFRHTLQFLRARGKLRE